MLNQSIWKNICKIGLFPQFSGWTCQTIDLETTNKRRKRTAHQSTSTTCGSKVSLSGGGIWWRNPQNLVALKAFFGGFSLIKRHCLVVWRLYRGWKKCIPSYVETIWTHYNLASSKWSWLIPQRFRSRFQALKKSQNGWKNEVATWRNWLTCTFWFHIGYRRLISIIPLKWVLMELPWGHGGTACWAKQKILYQKLSSSITQSHHS